MTSLLNWNVSMIDVWLLVKISTYTVFKDSFHEIMLALSYCFTHAVSTHPNHSLTKLYQLNTSIKAAILNTGHVKSYERHRGSVGKSARLQCRRSLDQNLHRAKNIMIQLTGYACCVLGQGILLSFASLTWAYQGGIGCGRYYNLSADRACT